MAYQDRNSRKIRSAVFFALFVALSIVGATRLAQANDKVSDNSSAADDKQKATSKKKDEKAGSPTTPQLKRRDPFVVPSRIKFEPPKTEIKKVPKPIGPPGMETRLGEYRNLVRAASLSGQPAPDKLSPYLAEDFTVTGIFRDSNGYGAFVLAGPTKLTFFARPGMRTYDGVVKEVTPTGVRFAKSIRYDDGSVRQVEEFRALRNGK
jgi:hypothetical protein